MLPLLLPFQQGSNQPDSGAQSGTLIAILIAVCVGVVDQLLKRYSVKLPQNQQAAVIQAEPPPPRRRRNRDEDDYDEEFDDEAASTVYKILQPQISAMKADISRIYEKLDEMSEEMQRPIQVNMDVNVKGDK